MADCPNCNCGEFDKCLKILNLMLDDEATPDQERYFFSHIEECITCFSHYNIEKQMRELLKSKVKRKRVPSEWVMAIRNRIIR